MEYREIIDDLLEREDLDEYSKAKVKKALEYDEAGIVIPSTLREFLRTLREKERVPPCANLDKRGFCIWLSKRAGVGKRARCPFYARQDGNPRECHRYKEGTEAPSRRGSITLYGGR